MKWFEKEQLKDKENLTDEQIDYLLQPSVAIMGPFNCIFRKQWDYLLTSAVLGIGTGVLLFTGSDDLGILSAICLIANYLLIAWITYFFVKNGRRLAWNRNKWKSFEAFQKSENRWYNFAVASLSLILVNIYFSIKNGADYVEIITEVITTGIMACAILIPFYQAWRKKEREYGSNESKELSDSGINP